MNAMVRTGAAFCGFSLTQLFLWPKWEAKDTNICNFFPRNEEVPASEIWIYRDYSENKT